MTTLELLWIVLAFCALWVAAFLCWAIYHIAMIARRVHVVLDEAKTMLGQIESVIGSLRDKVDHHAQIFDPLVGMASMALQQWITKKSSKNKS